MLHRRKGAEREHGQILVLFTLVLVVILVFASIAIDLGVLRNNKQILRNTMDAAALAGGTLLPVDGSVAGKAAAVNTLIDSTIQKNYPGLPTSAYTIAYRCLIGVSGNVADVSQVAAGVCNPSHALGHTATASDFTGAGPTRTSDCRPGLGDKCNVVVVTGTATTNYGFGGVVGITSGSTGAVQSAACNGPCGATPVTPTDLVVIIDRTASMSDADVQATRDAAKAVLQVYNPAYQRVALGLLGPSNPSSTCSGVSFGTGVKAYTSSSGYGTNTSTDLSKWIPVGLSGTDNGSPAPAYKEPYSTGTTQPYTLAPQSSNHLIAAINCFDSPGGTGTNLATPLLMAKAVLDADTRPNVTKGIILETDGQPNFGVGTASDYTCWKTNENATLVKNAGIKIYTIGFGLDGANNATCPDANGTTDSSGKSFYGKKATYVLASAASPYLVNGVSTASSDQFGCPGSGATNSNNDGDNFFCQPKSADLQAVFKYVALDLVSGGLHLIQLYPTPVVKSVSASCGSPLGGASVTITGQYFAGVLSVTVGGGAAAINLATATDTSITVTAPPGTSGSTVDILVTTGGGISPIVRPDDQCKYN
jgi:Flp pilus assembly protein TadG